MKKTSQNKFWTRLSKIFQVFLGKAYIYPKENYNFHRICFSQEGEDILLEKIFGGQMQGFYVDVGAHHPQRFSNTYLFYLKGWQGINIDAMPGSMDLFKIIRPRDINLESAVSGREEILTYYEFNEPALNTFSVGLSREYEKASCYQIIDTKEIRTKPLSHILSEHLNGNKIIDFMSIDVEGLDYRVLKSNNWDKFRPKVLIIEDLERREDPQKTEIQIFLEYKGYFLFSRLVNSVIFKDISCDI